MKTFVIGDIHGACRALLQCLERAEFDYKRDRLIVLGDVCDGYPEVRQAVDELLKIKQLDYVIGNHDLWFLDWAQKGIKEDIWLDQGGNNTVLSYVQDIPREHVRLFSDAHAWFEEEGRLFVHGGFDPRVPIARQKIETLVWDRDLLFLARKKYMTDPDFKFAGYDEIYVGHTTTENFHSSTPLNFCNVWAMDTGAGWSGKLTIMDVATKDYWQSEPTPRLYGPLQTRKA